MPMKEKDMAELILLRANSISRRYAITGAAAQEMLTELMELVKLAQEETEPDEPMPETKPH